MIQTIQEAITSREEIADGDKPLAALEDPDMLARYRQTVLKRAA